MHDDYRFLVLGDASRLPAVEGVRYSGDPAQPCDALAVVGGEPGWRLQHRLEELLCEPRLSYLPVADLCGAGLARADFSAAAANAESIAAAQREFAPITERARSLPALPDTGDRDALLALAAAALRNGRIEAAWAPQHPELVRYPLLLGLPRQEALLEQLTEMGLLRREFFDRVHICRQCSGSRLNTREECEDCRGSQLREAQLVHHFNCAYQGPETQFQSRDGLICPKCRRALRHYGVDYDKPGMVVYCVSCEHSAAEPAVGFRCLDCNAHTPAEQIQTRDWYHYVLLGDGEVAVRRGRLPQIAIEDLIAGLEAAHSPRTLALLLDHHLRLFERYKRPVSGWLITPTAIEALRERMGGQDSAEAFRLFVELLDEVLRQTDAVTAVGGSVVVVLPETDTTASEMAATRLRERIAASLTEPVEFQIETYGGERLRELLEVLA